MSVCASAVQLRKQSRASNLELRRMRRAGTMPKLLDLTNQRFGALVVVGREGPGWVRCRCDCGTELTATLGALRRGKTSCGCLWRSIKHGFARKSLLSTYNVWRGMMERCTNPRHPKWSIYGGAGIAVHAPWAERGGNGLRAFLNDLGPRPSKLHTLDRRDPNKGYEPGNCRWAPPTSGAVTGSIQANNRKTSLSFEGKTLAQWARKRRMSPKTIQSRLRRGWGWARALAQPVRRRS